MQNKFKKMQRLPHQEPVQDFPHQGNDLKEEIVHTTCLILVCLQQPQFPQTPQDKMSEEEEDQNRRP